MLLICFYLINGTFNQWNNNATERNEGKHFHLLTTLEYDNIRNKPNSEAHNMD